MSPRDAGDDGYDFDLNDEADRSRLDGRKEANEVPPQSNQTARAKFAASKSWWRRSRASSAPTHSIHVSSTKGASRSGYETNPPEKRLKPPTEGSMVMNVIIGVEADMPIETHAHAEKVGSYRIDPSSVEDLYESSLSPSSPSDDALMGALSPLAAVNVPAELRDELGIPVDASEFCFAYPLEHFEERIEQDESLSPEKHPWVNFVLAGGYCYFDAAGKLLRANALSRIPSVARIMLDGPFSASEAAWHAMNAEGRMAKVTLDALEGAGFRTFGWVRPSEQPGGHSIGAADVDAPKSAISPSAVSPSADSPAWENGAFLYSMRTGEYVYFRLSPKAHLAGGSVASSGSDFYRVLSALDAGRNAVRQLVSEGVSLDALDDTPGSEWEGLSALEYCAHQGLESAADVLLSLGACPRRALHIGYDRHNHRIAHAVLKRVMWLSELHAQPTEGHADVLLEVVAEATYDDHEALSLGSAIADAARADSVANALRLCLKSRARAAARAAAIEAYDPARADRYASLATQLELGAVGLLCTTCKDEHAIEYVLGTDAAREALNMAVSIEAKVFFSQPIVRSHVLRVWRGRALHDRVARLRGAHSWCAWGVGVLRLFAVLLLAFPALLLGAVFPPLAACLEEESRLPCGLRSAAVMRAPLVRFSASLVCDLALALVFTFSADLLAPSLAYPLLLWVGSGLAYEAHKLGRLAARLGGAYDALSAYYAERFNRLDSPALALALAAILVGLLSAGLTSAGLTSAGLTSVGEAAPSAPSGTAFTALRALAVLLLWTRMQRLFFFSSTYGPYMLLTFRIFSDVVAYGVLLAGTILSFAAAFVALYQPGGGAGVDGAAVDGAGVDGAGLHDGQTVGVSMPGASTPGVSTPGASTPGASNWPWSDAALDELIASDDGEGANCVAFFSAYSYALVYLLESAVGQQDFFACARAAPNSITGWALSMAFFTLSSLLLLNMLIAMMAKSFENVADASAVNYLLLFAQTTLSIAEQPPTPPPLNVLSLPYAIAATAARVLRKRARVASHTEDERRPAALTRANTFLHSMTQGERAADSMMQGVMIARYIIEHQDEVVQESRWRTVMAKEQSARHRRLMEKIKQQDDAIDQLAKESKDAQYILNLLLSKMEFLQEDLRTNGAAPRRQRRRWDDSGAPPAPEAKVRPHNALRAVRGAARLRNATTWRYRAGWDSQAPGEAPILARGSKPLPPITKSSIAVVHTSQ